MSTSELDSRNIAISMRKSVENLVISSQDAIGQSISQALTFSGVITQQAHQIIQDTRSVSRSPSPSLRNSEGPDSLENDKEFPGGDLSESRCSFLHASDTSIHLHVPHHPAGDSVSVYDLPVASPSAKGDKASTPNPSRNSETRTKKKSWYTSLYPTYKSKSDDFKRLFKDLPDDERLIVDYSCALQKDILAHGRLYASQNYLCFYASIFGWETSMTLRWKEVTAITKEKTALVIPNAILVCTESEKNFLTSFSGRDKAYLMLFRIWQNALMDQPCSSQEIWQWVHSCYGEELGFGSDDEGYSRDLLQHEVLPLDTHSEHELLDSCMDGAGGGRDDRPRSARDRSPPLVTNGDAESEYRVGVGDADGEGDGEGEADALPTDMSDSSDSGDKHTEVEKCTSGHGGKLLLQSQFPFNIDQLFTMIFTNSKFNLELLAARGTTDYVQAPWQPAGGVKCRQVSYVLGLTSGPIGPKEVHVTETQIMNKCSKPGLLYSIDATSENSGIPYADYFTVEVHYCLCRVSDHTTMLTLYGHIKYKKSMWPMVKAFLEKNAMAGIEEYAQLLETRLAGEAESAQPLTRTARRRKHAHASPAAPYPPPARAHPPARGGAAAPRPAPPRARPPADWLPAALLLLLLLNGLLYWKLYHPPHTTIHDLQAKMQALQEPGQAEWATLLDAHSRRRRGQLLAWREALGSTRARLQQTEEALRNLLETIETSLAKDEETSSESTEPTHDGTETDTTDERAHSPPEDTSRSQHKEL